MITQKKNNSIKGQHQKPIITDVFYKDDNDQKPVVIFCHGYKGFKDWGTWDLVAQHFAEKGCFFVKFNFSHNGCNAEQPTEFLDLDAFGENNYIKELDDLQSVIDWIMADDFPFKNQINDSIALIGHSRGGGIVTIKAAEVSGIGAVISWAGVADYASRFPTNEALQKWKDEGVMYVINGRTKQKMPHYFQYYTKFKENEERLTISNAAKALEIPHLIIHGTGDPAVSFEEAKLLHQWNPNSSLVLIPEADHVFGARHPWDSRVLPEPLSKVVEETISFVTG